MNNHSSENYLRKIKESMQSFQEEVGTFRGESELNTTTLDQEHSLRTLALEYDNCIVNVDLVTNNKTRLQFVNHFDLAA